MAEDKGFGGVRSYHFTGHKSPICNKFGGEGEGQEAKISASNGGSDAAVGAVRLDFYATCRVAEGGEKWEGGCVCHGNATRRVYWWSWKIL